MKFKWFLSAALALTASSTAMASSDLSGQIKLGQQLGRISNPIATQCSIVDKAQAESKSDRSSGGSRGSTNNGAAE